MRIKTRVCGNKTAKTVVARKPEATMAVSCIFYISHTHIRVWSVEKINSDTCIDEREMEMGKEMMEKHEEEEEVEENSYENGKMGREVKKKKVLCTEK